jgi:hypothetical protein
MWSNLQNIPQSDKEKCERCQHVTSFLKSLGCRPIILKKLFGDWLFCAKPQVDEMLVKTKFFLQKTRHVVNCLLCFGVGLSTFCLNKIKIKK